MGAIQQRTRIVARDKYGHPTGRYNWGNWQHLETVKGGEDGLALLAWWRDLKNSAIGGVVNRVCQYRYVKQ
jgi:hypothetical protein